MAISTAKRYRIKNWSPKRDRTRGLSAIAIVEHAAAEHPGGGAARWLQVRKVRVARYQSRGAEGLAIRFERR